MKKMVLNMHVGFGKKKSKTEAVYSPLELKF